MRVPRRLGKRNQRTSPVVCNFAVVATSTASPEQTSPGKCMDVCTQLMHSRWQPSYKPIGGYFEWFYSAKCGIRKQSRACTTREPDSQRHWHRRFQDIHYAKTDGPTLWIFGSSKLSTKEDHESKDILENLVKVKKGQGLPLESIKRILKF